MKFESEKDWWFSAIIWGAVLFAAGSGAVELFTEDLSINSAVSILLPTLILPALVIWLWKTTYYILDEKNLLVRSGPIKKTIPLASIRSAKKSSNPLSSPALSLKRIEIRYGTYHRVLISPKDRDEFLRQLAKRCPQADIER
jgi:hypothetical protein